MNFPKNFLFGSSTSSHQIEGGQKNDWSEWEKIPGRIVDGSDSKIACDSWNKWDDDVKLLEQTDQNAYRFSIEWSRIEPRQGYFDKNAIEHYRKILLRLKSKNITRMVTLFHFTLPNWLSKMGGFSNPKSVEYFSRFAEKIGREYGKIVDYWVTINEPQAYLLNGYIMGTYCPGKKNLFEAYFRARKNIINAHNRAYQKMKPIVSGQIGIVQHLVALEPLVPHFINRVWVKLTHYFTTYELIRPIAKHTDFIGINYYMKFKLQAVFPRLHISAKKLSDYGWGINQEGLYQVIMESARWKKPIFITENGVADHDDKYRKRFIKDAFENIQKAIASGADVRGYFHWSLLDNFEWSKGYSMKFGLFDINRQPRDSAFYYRDLIREASDLPPVGNVI